MTSSTLFSQTPQAPTLFPTTTSRPRTIYEYVLVVASTEQEEIDEPDGCGYQVPAHCETLFPVFDHEPTQQDWVDFLAGWRGAGFVPVSSPQSINRSLTEF